MKIDIRAEILTGNHMTNKQHFGLLVHSVSRFSSHSLLHQQ
jgi:hypothetical protein